MDLSNVFLHDDIQEDIYMSPPQGMLPSYDKRVCKLKKFFNCLKQTNRNQYQKFTIALVNFGYTQSHLDYTLFFQSKDSSFTCLLIYVDDLIKYGNIEDQVQELKSYLHTHFYINDLRKLKCFLRIEVSQSSKHIFLSQRKYALHILHEFGQLCITPSSIPMKHNQKDSKEDASLKDPSTYI